MSGYLERLVRRGLGGAGVAMLRPRGDARPAEEPPEVPQATILEGTAERSAEAAAWRPLGEAAELLSPARFESEEGSGDLGGRSPSRAEKPAARGFSPPRSTLLPRTPHASTASARIPSQLSRASGGPLGSETGRSPFAAGPYAAPSPPRGPVPAAAGGDRRRPDGDSRAASDASLTSGPADAIAPASPRASRRASEHRLDRAAIESLATALVARRLAAVKPEVTCPVPASGRRLDGVRLHDDGPPRIEVHIDCVEVVQAAAPTPDLTTRPPRPGQRGFAALKATRSHLGRPWY